MGHKVWAQIGSIIPPIDRTIRMDAALSMILAGVVLAPVTGIFTALAMSPLLALIAIGILATGGWRDLTKLQLSGWVLAALLAAFVWALVTCLWSPSGLLFSARGVSQIFGVAVGGYVLLGRVRKLDQSTLRIILFWLIASLTLTLLFMFMAGLVMRVHSLPFLHYESRRYIDFSLHLDRGVTIAALLFWPSLFCLNRSGHAKLALALAALTGVTILLNSSLTGKIAFFGGWIVWGIERFSPGLGLKSLRLGIIGFLLSFPLIATQIPSIEAVARWDKLPSSAQHRLIIWKFVSEKIAEHPLTGWGYESARTIGNHQTFSTPLPNGLILTGEILPLHPHNGTLQVWLELGGIGISLLALFLWLSLGCMQVWAGQPVAPYVAAVVAGSFIISNVSYGLWQSWWLSTIWLCAAILAAIAAHPDFGADAMPCGTDDI